MATYQSTILPALDAVRAIGGLLGLRVFTVTVRIRTWAGPRVGLGGCFDRDVPLTVQAANGTKQNVHVRQVSRREAIASGGKYTDRDLRVGPITPPYAAAFGLSAGGFSDTTLDIQPAPQPTEIFWIVASPSGSFGVPPGGAFFDKIGEEATSLHTVVILRQTGRVP